MRMSRMLVESSKRAQSGDYPIILCIQFPTKTSFSEPYGISFLQWTRDTAKHYYSEELHTYIETTDFTKDAILIVEGSKWDQPEDMMYRFIRVIAEMQDCMPNAYRESRPAFSGGPVNGVTKTCFVCKSPNNVKRCGKCKCIYYCSIACQKADWDIHRLTCRFSPSRAREDIRMQIRFDE